MQCNSSKPKCLDVCTEIDHSEKDSSLHHAGVELNTHVFYREVRIQDCSNGAPSCSSSAVNCFIHHFKGSLNDWNLFTSGQAIEDTSERLKLLHPSLPKKNLNQASTKSSPALSLHTSILWYYLFILICEFETDEFFNS